MGKKPYFRENNDYFYEKYIEIVQESDFQPFQTDLSNLEQPTPLKIVETITTYGIYDSLTKKYA